MALISECRQLCANNVLDRADIVRDGDLSINQHVQFRTFLNLASRTGIGQPFPEDRVLCELTYLKRYLYCG